MTPEIEAMPLHNRIVHVCELLSTVHRLADGKPGRLEVDGKVINYPYVLDMERETQQPALFKMPEGMDTHPLIAWLRETPANYREGHKYLSHAVGLWWDEKRVQHGAQKVGVVTRLWKTPTNTVRDHRREIVTPLPSTPKPKRVIRDR